MSSTSRDNGVPGVGLADVPVEIMLEIFQHSDIRSIAALSRSSNRIRRIITANWALILQPAINREMGPIKPFMRVLDVRHPGRAPALPVLIQAIGNEGSPDPPPSVRVDFVQPLDILPVGWASGLSFSTVMGVCAITKVWEDEFHRLRFAFPYHRRTLKEHELWRLRHALYVWWVYAGYFHEDPQSSDSCGGIRYSPEARIEFVRRFSTSQLHEMRDMWETVTSAVSKEVCPSVSDVREKLVCRSRCNPSRCGLLIPNSLGQRRCSGTSGGTHWLGRCSRE